MRDGASSLSSANKVLIHQAFSPNANWPYDWENFPPVNLRFYSRIAMVESTLAGSEVARLQVLGAEDQNVSFEWASGQGDTHNSFFEISEDGEVRTLDGFDGEGMDGNLSIRVRAILPDEEPIEQSFTVQLVPQDEGVGSYQFDSGTALGGGGDGNSSTYENFSSIEPIAGWSESEGNQTIEYVGYLAEGSGDLGQGSDLILSVRPGVAENAPIGTVIGRFVADDPDTNTTVSYSIVDSNDSNHSHDLFHIESGGVLTTLGTFDFETTTHYLINIQATDEKGGVTTKEFTIEVLDVFEDLDGDGIEDHLDEDMDGDGFSNVVEAAYGSDPRDSNSMANQGNLPQRRRE